jgi:hypothetical protein
MRIAQSLYEGVELGEEGSVGLITYMRTDSYNVSDDAITAVREVITNAHGKEYLPATPNTFTQRKGAQLAHEAIRPTYLEQTPEKVAPFLTADQLKLYKMIWARFLASQMAPAQFDLTDAKIHSGRYQFTARGRRMIFPERVFGRSGTMMSRCRSCRPSRRGRRSCCRSSTSRSTSRSAAALHRGDAGEGAREEGHRASEHVRDDHLDHPGARLRQAAGPRVPRHATRRDRHRDAGRQLPAAHGLGVHRRARDAPRRDRGGEGRLARHPEEVLRQVHGRPREGDQDMRDYRRTPTRATATRARSAARR